MKRLLIIAVMLVAGLAFGQTNSSVNNPGPVYNSFPTCSDSIGQHLNFNAATLTFSCGTTVPATVVKTGQSNTWTTGAQDLSAATALVVPRAAGATTTTNGGIVYDNTTKNIH